MFYVASPLILVVKRGFNPFGVEFTAADLFLDATIFSQFKSDKKPLHGNASFANLNEIKAAKLLNADLNKPSIILGKFANQQLEFSDSKFMSLAAHTSSGKGVSIVTPSVHDTLM
jgi:type IV secretory pathway TraG/TraD family ATPase VirD4